MIGACCALMSRVGRQRRLSARQQFRWSFNGVVQSEKKRLCFFIGNGSRVQTAAAFSAGVAPRGRFRDLHPFRRGRRLGGGERRSVGLDPRGTQPPRAAYAWHGSSDGRRHATSRGRFEVNRVHLVNLRSGTASRTPVGTLRGERAAYAVHRTAASRSATPPWRTRDLVALLALSPLSVMSRQFLQRPIR